MPSAHGPIYCRKELREKVLSEGPIFSRTESAHTDRFFVVSNSEKRSERFFFGAKVSAHEPTTNRSDKKTARVRWALHGL